MSAYRNIVVLYSVSVLYCSVYTQVAIGCIKDDAVLSIVRLLEEMPRWPCLPLVDTSPDYERDRQRAITTAREIEDIAERISKYELDDIRAAFVLYSVDHTRREALEIMNRYLFNIPMKPNSGTEVERMVRYRFAVPLLTDESKMTTSFPWAADEAGHLRFSVEAKGFVGFGRPYDGVKVFDYYRRQFGRRKALNGR